MRVSWAAQSIEISTEFVPVEIERIVNDILLQCFFESRFGEECLSVTRSIDVQILGIDHGTDQFRILSKFSLFLVGECSSFVLSPLVSRVTPDGLRRILSILWCCLSKKSVFRKKLKQWRWNKSHLNARVEFHSLQFKLFVFVLVDADEVLLSIDIRIDIFELLARRRCARCSNWNFDFESFLRMTQGSISRVSVFDPSDPTPHQWSIQDQTFIFDFHFTTQ